MLHWQERLKQELSRGTILKILQINSHYNQGGAAKIVTCIHEQLKLEGMESYVAYGRGKVINDPNVVRFNTVPEIYGSALFTRVTGLSGWFNYAAKIGRAHV